MARGESGRVVIEVDPKFKEALYAELDRRGLTLRAWFIAEAEQALGQRRELPILAAEEEPTRYPHVHPNKLVKDGRE